MMSRRFFLSLALVFLALGALSGCSEGVNNSAWTTPAVPDRVPIFVASSSLPFDAYKLSDSRLAAMQSAFAKDVGRCAENYGVQMQFSGDYIPPSDRSRSMTGDPLGTLTLEQASRYGYHATRHGAWAPTGGFYVKDVANVQPNKPSDSTDSQEELVLDVAYGPSSNSNSPKSKPISLPTDLSGASIPKGGCFGLVENELRAPLTSLVQLQARLMNLGLAHPSVARAINNWSICMKTAGYTYSSPQDASSKFALTLLTPEEVSTAVADVRCTRSSRWADIYYFVLSKYEHQAIEKEPGLLQRVLSSQQARSRALDLS